MIKDSIKGNWKRLAAVLQARCAISREGARRPLEIPETVLRRPQCCRKGFLQTYGGTP